MILGKDQRILKGFKSGLIRKQANLNIFLNALKLMDFGTN